MSANLCTISLLSLSSYGMCTKQILHAPRGRGKRMMSFRYSHTGDPVPVVHDSAARCDQALLRHAVSGGV